MNPYQLKLHDYGSDAIRGAAGQASAEGLIRGEDELKPMGSIETFINSIDNQK